MGLAVLDRRRHFAEGLVELALCRLLVGLGAGGGDEEQRVVAEATASMPFVGDSPIALTTGHEFTAVGEHCCDGRHVVGGALLVRDAGLVEETQELVVVRLVVAVGLSVPAPAGGVETRRAVEGVDAQP